MKADQDFYQAETREQNIYQLFEEHLNSLFYEGYAMQLAEENPDAFEFELSNFLTIF